MTDYISLDNLTLYDSLIKQYINAGGNTNIYFGECSTGNTTATKVVTCNGYALSAGSIIIVHFTNNQQSLLALKLNVNSTGAKSVRIFNKVTSTSYSVNWCNDDRVIFQYDGTYWNVIGKEAIIYYNSSGVGTGNITLQRSLAYFNYIDIIFTDGTRSYSSRVYNPSGKTTSIQRVVNNTTTQYLDSMMLTLGTTTITIGNSRQSVLTNSVSSNNTQTLKITEIRGG